MLVQVADQYLIEEDPRLKEVEAFEAECGRFNADYSRQILEIRHQEQQNMLQQEKQRQEDLRKEQKQLEAAFQALESRHMLAKAKNTELQELLRGEHSGM